MNEQQPAIDRRPGSVRTALAVAGVLLCHTVTLSIWVAIVAFLVPRLLTPLVDFDADLPPTTILLINVSSLAVHYWYLLFLLLIPDGIVYFVLYRLPAAANWLAACWAMFILMLGTLLIGWAVVSIMVPLADLFEKLR